MPCNPLTWPAILARLRGTNLFFVRTTASCPLKDPSSHRMRPARKGSRSRLGATSSSSSNGSMASQAQDRRSMTSADREKTIPPAEASPASDRPRLTPAARQEVSRLLARLAVAIAVGAKQP